jgi:hypothetical protein
MAMTNTLPKMVEVRQTYRDSQPFDFPSLLHERFIATRIREQIKPGMKIALGVGSRGIANLQEIVKATLGVLVTAGASPFLIPAMGSHGGATPEGQTNVLAGYGITPETMGVPIEASMEVQKIGTALGGLDVVFSVPALKADGIVVLNRIKPHTDFRGTIGSGIQKMLTIGFGKQVGAANAHRAAARVGHEIVIREFSKVILDRVPVLCGVAIVEDQHHQTADIEVLRSENIAREEERLFEKARSLMPHLPLDEIDLLIVDQIGKEISGSGMDTNVIGRDITGYSTSLHSNHPVTPHIFRIFVRDLSPATNGNGTGIGLADFTTSRAVKALDLRYTYMNSLTAIGLQPAKIPIHFDKDHEAIQQALLSLASATPDSLRVVRIANTLSLDRFLASESCVDLINRCPGVTIVGEARDMQFDSNGNLLQL